MLKLKDLLVKASQRSVAVLFMFMASTMMLWAQEMNEKFSMTTQMFMNELKERVEQPVKGPRRAPRHQISDNLRMKKSRRFIASPDTVGGIAYISCFIHLKDVENLSQVRSLGVEVEETFSGQDFITARVPVNELEALADIDNVTKIKVARQMRLLTDVARQKTNVDDLLTQSADAITAGVTSMYDGTGVVLGIIDTGIDFQHIAFKDKDGNSRIKKAYVYNGSSAQEYSTITSSSPTTDDKSEDHGTHTASTAGGSSVIVSSSTVTVTDNHANATYGGMAPGADLYLAGVNGLEDTYLTNALKKMVTYADGQGKPLVVSNSWGSGWGPHDGTGEYADLVAQYFGDSHPNHIILFAASNDAGRSTATEGGGFFVKKNSATSSSPLGTIIRTEGEGGNYYVGVMACAWASRNLNCKLYVLDNSGTILKTWTVTRSQSSFSGLSTYYSGSLTVYIEQENGKYNLFLYSDNNDPLETSGNYTLAVEVYPSSGNANINMWAGDWTYFTNHLSTSGHTWIAGTDDMCVSDEATIPDAISVGAYVSKKQWKSSDGRTYAANEYTVGDIAYFSSYATAELSPTGEAYPWITAPGARLAAGVNHYHTASVDDYSYYGTNFKTDLVVNNKSNPYAMMEGTSMATPVAAGIVALWLQAAQSVGKDLTVNDVKDIMEQTAINDSYTTTGANASHFGKGKIDALAGIQYILASSSSPFIMASPTSIDFTGNYSSDMSKTETVTVRGMNLETGITVTLNDPSGIYSVSSTDIPLSVAESGADISVTWTPTSIGTTSATITLSSSGAEDVVINLTGTVSIVHGYALVTDASTLQAGDEILIASVNGNESYALSTNQKTNNREATNDVTLNADGTLTPGDKAQVITLEKDGSNYLFNVGTGYLYAGSSSSNQLKTTTTVNDNAKASISISSGSATITFQGTNSRNIIRYNPNNGSPLFSCYSSTSTTGSLPQIYSKAPVALNNYGTRNTDVINVYNNAVLNVTLASRTLYKDGTWNTICLPFDVVIADSPLAGADVRAMSSASLEDEVLTLNFTSPGEVSSITAGTPYIIKWANGTDISDPVFRGVTVSAGNNDFTSTDGKVRFIGTYDLISFDAEDKNILFIGDANKIYYPLAGARIGAFHCYLQIPDDSSVKQFVLNIDGVEDPTSIEHPTLDIEHSEGAIYNLSGQMVNGKLPKGIYIHNGRKVVK